LSTQHVGIRRVLEPMIKVLPRNFRYAEIKYTQGGYEHLEMAKTYYSHAVKLNPSNMRALYGLLQV
jgi:hypothetical protein